MIKKMTKGEKRHRHCKRCSKPLSKKDEKFIKHSISENIICHKCDTELYLEEENVKLGVYP